MEKGNRVVISKKEEKKLNDLLRLFDIIGFDPEKINDLFKELDGLKKENADLKAENLNLKKSVDEFKKEAKEFIQRELNQISVNVHNEVVKSTENVQQNIRSYLFKGKKIDENY